MRIYKLISCHYVLEAIRNRRLKVSTIDSLNDPFELMPFDLSNDPDRHRVAATKRRLGKKFGMLCFSRDWTNPVIWAHYADSHKGMCLGFDIPDSLFKDGLAIEVVYIPKPLPFPEIVDTTTALSMQRTKFDNWLYETEVRIFTTLTEMEGGLCFKNMDHETKLAEVILGVGCGLKAAHLKHEIGPYANSISIYKARREYNAFKMARELMESI